VSAPRILDRYVPIKSFRGGMGVVHACADAGAQPGEPIGVAVKTFRPELLADVESRESFVREASTWMRIGDHPHVVAARMVRRDGEQVYVVCDLVVPPEGVRGPSLRAHLDRALPPRRAIELALGIVRGMHHATSQVPGLVHRDLKPENVLVGADGRARVTDFGLALTGDVAAAVAGTLPYMAPEQLRAKPELRSDVYAVGLILLEMLTGETGVPLGGSKTEIIAAHIRGRPSQVAAQAPLPQPIRELLVRWTHATAEQRPPSWQRAEEELLALWPLVAPKDPLPAPPTAIEATREDQLRLAWSELGIANSFLDIAALTDAGHTYDRLLQRARGLDDVSLQAAALNGRGQVKAARGDVDGALVDLDAAIDLRRKLGDAAGEARAQGNRGNALARLRRVDDARVALERAAALSFEAGRRADYVSARFNLLQLQMMAKDFDAAERGARWCEEAFGDLADVRGRAVALGVLGHALRMRGDPEAALEASRGALQCFRRIADRQGEARELALQGNTLRALKRPVEAVDALSASIALATEIGDQQLLGSASFALADMTPPLPEFAASGRKHALAAAAAYRAIGREDLAKDADALVARFPETG
jgi:tetratricopeptide (TPR) repeat protein